MSDPPPQERTSAERPSLDEAVEERIAEIGDADIVLGVPSYNNASTIGHVVRALLAGLAKYFPDQRAVLVNSDGGSSDGTRDVVLASNIDDRESILITHPSGPIASFSLPYHGIPGKGSAFRTIFAIAKALHAKGCAVVDSDLRSITPEWVELLLKPVLSGRFDYVAPLYRRHKYDGTITNSIVYPMTRALFGKRIRQPIGGDFGFSGDLAAFYLSKDVWESDVARYGIDIWMTITAVANGFRVCQSYLGAKIHDPKDPGADLSAMLHQVIGSTIELMGTYPQVWSKVHASEPIPTFGFPYAVGLEPVAVNLERMLDRFQLGLQELGSLWATYLPETVMEALEEARSAPAERFTIPDPVWVEIVYRLAGAYHQRTMNREHLLKSFTPLYIGKTASFVIEAAEMDADEVERRLESLCETYETMKPSLLANWE